MNNAVLNLLVLVALTAVLAPRLRRLRPGPILWAALIMLVLTIVFDTAMIAAGLVSYAPDKMLGVRVWRAPVEDFAYTLVAVVLMPVCWTALGRARRSGPAGPAPDGDS